METKFEDLKKVVLCAVKKTTNQVNLSKTKFGQKGYQTNAQSNGVISPFSYPAV